MIDGWRIRIFSNEIAFFILKWQLFAFQLTCLFQENVLETGSGTNKCTILTTSLIRLYIFTDACKKVSLNVNDAFMTLLVDSA